jgi:hypothetical protein
LTHAAVVREGYPSGGRVDAVTFRSRIDLGLAALIFGPLIAACGLVLQRAVARGQIPSMITVGTLAASIGLVAWIFATTAYRLTERELLVTSGPLRVRVPLAEIRRVTRTHSLLSAPALSLQRLEIAYATHGLVVISPKDEAAFLATLKAKAPGVELPGGG